MRKYTNSYQARNFWLRAAPDPQPSVVEQRSDDTDDDFDTGNVILTDISDSTKKLEDAGIILLSGEIGEKTLLPIITFLLCKHSDPSWTSEVQIIIDSPGGLTSSAWALVDMMGFVRFPVATIATGRAMSAGMSILAAGDQGLRFVFQNTELMTHQFTAGLFGKYQDVREGQISIDQEYEREINFWLAHSNFTTRKDIEKYLLRPVDTYLKPEQALEYGLIDGIVPSNRKSIKGKKGKKKSRKAAP